MVRKTSTHNMRNNKHEGQSAFICIMQLPMLFLSFDLLIKLMNIALISIIKPMEGSGDGTTEYAHQLYRNLSKSNTVDNVYSLSESKRLNMKGLVYTNTLFKHKLKSIKNSQYDIIHITSQEAGFAAKIFYGKTKVVTTVHDLMRIDGSFHEGISQQMYNKLVKKNVIDAIKYSDYILFDSNQAMTDFQKVFSSKINGLKMKVVPLGIDKRFSSKKIKYSRHNVFRVGYIGSFAKHKNVSLLLKCANELKEEKGINFEIYGTGAMQEPLYRYAKDNNLSNVSFKGFAPNEHLIDIYDNFNVFVFPSLYEGFGLPILEAQARGVPVIIYKYGKISQEVKKHCLEARNEAHMARIIKQLKSKGYGESKRSKAMEYARSFTWERCAKETFGVYAKLYSK